MFSRNGHDPVEPGTSAKYEMFGEEHMMVFDGKVEDAILKRVKGKPGEFITSLEELQAVVRDDGGELARAKQRLEQGEDSAEVDVGKGEKWIARKRYDNGGGIELFNPGMMDQQVVGIWDNHVSINTFADDTLGNDSVRQTIEGRWNPQSGTITCISEDIESAAFRNGGASAAH